MDKKNVIFVISGRCGCELEEPKLTKTQKDADEWVRRKIAELVIEDFSMDLKEVGIIPEDTALVYDKGFNLKSEYIEPVLEWGIEHEYCTDNTYQYCCDWTEYTVTMLKIPA